MGNCLYSCGHKNEKQKKSLYEGMLFAMGNPLLDIIATVDANFLRKYDLKANDAILATPKHVPLYQELIANYQVEYLAGGADQNTLRAVQWILNKPKITAFIGATGTDEFSRILEETALQAGINVQYLKLDKFPTGTCAVLITGKDRSLVANLAAAEHFPKDHLLRPENFDLVKKARFYYITGYFLTVSVESILTVASHAAEENKVFSMNLAATFIPLKFTEELLSVFTYIDILFGNSSEAEAFSSALKLNTQDITEIAKHVAQLPKKNASRPRLVIFTQGPENVIVLQGTVLSEYPVTKLAPEQIKDTNGAGDAFAGGFLAQYIQGESIEECVNCAIYAATEVIQQSGCSFPKDKTYIKRTR